MQNYAVRTPNSVADRNRLRRKNAAKTGRSPVLFDESLVYYTKTYMCTHSESLKPRGSGSRANHTVRSIGCKAKLIAVLSCTKDGEYSVCVSSHKPTHNHPVTADVFYTYVEARKVTSPTTLRYGQEDVERCEKYCLISQVDAKTPLLFWCIREALRRKRFFATCGTCRESRYYPRTWRISSHKCDVSRTHPRMTTFG
ncbi:hypothetical protein PHMEG_00032141 [Phytophthora megakarya]|uniref:FAR1 domain-containing protein n=1 Tax=Phytophthora megakarya TaxID=4795 RepID=A0A225UWZ0_9STRA|nr:hypothetical protein PHMEG_00032141 [Phytophthora megakarya]